MQLIAQPPPAASVLDQVVHQRLIQDMKSVCETANVPPTFLHHSMKDYCKAVEIDWVKRFKHYRAENLGGLVLDGVQNSQTRCLAIGGALLRNFIDARVLSLATLINLKDAVPEPTVLIIPNFHLKATGKSNGGWKGQVMYDLLMARMIAMKPTVVCIEQFDAMEMEYGPMVAELLRNNFKRITE